MYCRRIYNEKHIRLNENKLGYCCKMTMPYDDKKRHQEVWDMLAKGSMPPECHLCKKAENKGIESWRQQGNKTFNVERAYLEITLDNTCDLACAYCYGGLSSVWQQAIKTMPAKFNGKLDALGMQANNVPYIEGKKIIFDNVKEIASLNHPSTSTIINLLGGEPLLSKFFKNNNLIPLVDMYYDVSKNQKNLALIITTNGSTPTKLLQKYIDQISILKEKYKTLYIQIMISNESTEEVSEYIRWGSNWKFFMNNVETWCESCVDDITFITTVNALSITKTKSFFIFVNKLNKIYDRNLKASLSTVYEPVELSISILDNNFIKYLQEAEEYCKKENLTLNGLSFDSLAKMIGKNVDKKYKLRNTFEYYTEVRQLNFAEIVPEVYTYIMDET